MERDDRTNWRGPTWFEPRLPSSAECSIGRRLLERATAAPNDVFAVCADGTEITNVALLSQARAIAAQMQTLGVRQGDVVGVWLPNGVTMLASIFACSIVGAVCGQINIAFRGNILAHALRTLGCSVMIAHSDLVERLASVECGALRHLIVTDDTPATELAITMDLAWKSGGDTIELAQLDAWDLSAIIFTSGTTGPSKGVRVTCCQLWSLAHSFYGYMSDKDRMLLALPLFHIASLGALWGAVGANASIAIMESIRADCFWDVVRGCGVSTTMGLTSAFAEILMKAPHSHTDKDHALRKSLVTYVNPTIRAFSARFDVEVFAGFSMTETSAVTLTPFNPEKDNCIGRPRKGIEVRIVDEHDVEVAPGTAGELILRSDIPWVLNDGYHGAPEATAIAWRNGWFHTGDLVLADADGDIYYRDRLKDSIRRRGENISSIEVETEVRAVREVADAAAIGVKSGDDEEIMVVVAPRDGMTIDPRSLIEALVPRMPHYMVPRYIRVMDQLPLTQTTKVMKSLLRAQGLTADTWDREAAGIVVRRQNLRSDF